MHTARPDEPDALDAAQALAAVSRQRAALADRLVTPRWYHPSLGVLVGVILAVQEFDHSVATVVTEAVAAAGVGLLTQLYSRVTGVWVNGFRPGATLGLVIAYAGA